MMTHGPGVAANLRVGGLGRYEVSAVRVKRVLAAAVRVSARSRYLVPIAVRVGRDGLIVWATDGGLAARWVVPWVGAGPRRDGALRVLCPEAARWLVKALRGVGVVSARSRPGGMQVGGVVFPLSTLSWPGQPIARFFALEAVGQSPSWLGSWAIAAVGDVFKSCEPGPVQVETLYPSGAPAADEHPSRGLAVRYTSEHCSVVVMGVRKL